MRDTMAFLGALYGAAMSGGAGLATLGAGLFGMPLRFGVPGTGGLALMGAGIAAYGILKFASDDR